MNCSLSKPFLGFIFFIIFLLSNQIAKSSHLRAGEIIATKISTFEYEFTLVLYRNTAGALQPNATFEFSDGTKQTVNVFAEPTNLENGTEKMVFKVKKTFSGASNYIVSFEEEYRNAGILNINNGNSRETPFYVETEIVIDPLGGPNSSPQFLYPPIDKGYVNKTFTHSAAAFDSDGDSLSFELITPQSEKGKTVPNYTSPNNIPTANSGTFNIDGKTGLITWDSPKLIGLYNIAFKVYEWRNGYRIGYVTRDMQIDISATTFNNPKLEIPRDTCITAGKLLKGIATASYFVGENNHNISAISGIFSLPSPRNASYFTSNRNINIDSLFFSWQTSCALIQAQPYQVTFRAENKIGNSVNSLVALKVWQIKIIPPALENLKIVANGRKMNLTWSAYSCSNIESIVVLRKDCSTDTTLFIDSCSTGNQSPEGYKLIRRLNRNVTSFVDDNFGKGLDFQTQYCYYLYAEFPSPQNGYSRASALACSALDNEVPLIVQASVLKTDSVNGKVEIKWTKPSNLKIETPAPYEIKLSRIESNDNVVGVYNRQFVDSLALGDTVFVDSTANTVANNLRYYIEFSANGKLVYTSQIASTVLLRGIGRNKKAQLKWTFNTPWTNDTTYIYRSSDGEPAFLDTVFAATGYIDDNLEIGKKYTYYVKTKGGLGCDNSPNSKNRIHPIYNLSQSIDIIPTDEVNDTLRPCAPTLYITKTGNCEDGANTTNSLNWVPNFDFLCDSNIVGYKLYKQNNATEYSLYLDEILNTTTFEGSAGKAVSGCFSVAAVNGKGLESDKSNVVCSDSCYYFELPNIFTPNGDNYNDKFTPKPFPRNINAVKFTVYNRWGSEIFYSDDDININWTGENAQDGLYYYKAEIEIGSVAGTTTEKKNLKGWVLIAR
ncbi:MAG: gliding motility-associated C-terminal domain-containing protein [Cytophagales bacterium]